MNTDIDSFISVPLPTALVGELLKRSPHGISRLIENVLTDFLERTEIDFSPPPPVVGVRWESLFLPNGTLLRTKYFGEFKYAEIKNESIQWKGNAYPSFAQLVNSMRGNTQNNAWRELELKRPSDQFWVSAQSLRQ